MILRFSPQPDSSHSQIFRKLVRKKLNQTCPQASPESNGLPLEPSSVARPLHYRLSQARPNQCNLSFKYVFRPRKMKG